MGRISRNGRLNSLQTMNRVTPKVRGAVSLRVSAMSTQVSVDIKVDVAEILNWILLAYLLLS
jgi:hypothetical protein